MDWMSEKEKWGDATVTINTRNVEGFGLSFE